MKVIRMKRKLKLPILLLAAVAMRSIFYIKEASKDIGDQGASGDTLDSTVLYPEFSELRLNHLEEVNLTLSEYEAKIASGELNANEVSECSLVMEDIKRNVDLEMKFEDALLENYDYDDVLVLIGEDYIDVRIYTEEDVRKNAVSIMKLVSEHFDSYRTIKITPVAKTD